MYVSLLTANATLETTGNPGKVSAVRPGCPGNPWLPLALGSPWLPLAPWLRNRARVVGFEDFRRIGSMKDVKEQGLLRLEGKTCGVQDGDIIEIL